MSQTTYEEASRCPRCGKPGEVMSKQPAPNMPKGTKVHLVYCRTKGCRWENTAWPIQVNPDGSVPVIDHSRTEKEYPSAGLDTEIGERLVKSLEKQLEAETSPEGGEVRNPRS